MNYYRIPPAATFVQGSIPWQQRQPKSRRTYNESFVSQLPPGYQLVPLGQQPSPLAPPQSNKWMLILLAVAVIAALIWFSKNKSKGPRSIKKVSTSRLAKNLYRRLERNPKSNETLMRSLAQHARE